MARPGTAIARVRHDRVRQIQRGPRRRPTAAARAATLSERGAGRPVGVHTKSRGGVIGRAARTSISARDGGAMRRRRRRAVRRQPADSRPGRRRNGAHHPPERVARSCRAAPWRACTMMRVRESADDHAGHEQQPRIRPAAGRSCDREHEDHRQPSPRQTRDSGTSPGGARAATAMTAPRRHRRKRRAGTVRRARYAACPEARRRSRRVRLQRGCRAARAAPNVAHDRDRGGVPLARQRAPELSPWGWRRARREGDERGGDSAAASSGQVRRRITAGWPAGVQQRDPSRRLARRGAAARRVTAGWPPDAAARRGRGPPPEPDRRTRGEDGVDARTRPSRTARARASGVAPILRGLDRRREHDVGIPADEVLERHRQRGRRDVAIHVVAPAMSTARS